MRYWEIADRVTEWFDAVEGGGIARGMEFSAISATTGNMSDFAARMALSTWAGVRCASEHAKRGAGMFSAFDARSPR